AIRRLRLIAEQCGQVSRIRPVLRSAHVFGELPGGVVGVGGGAGRVRAGPAGRAADRGAEPPGCGWLVELLGTWATGNPRASTRTKLERALGIRPPEVLVEAVRQEAEI